MERPSICFVAQYAYSLLASQGSSPAAGGAELQQVLIATELVRRGYRVSFITLDHGQGAVSTAGPFEVLGSFRPHQGIPVLRFVHPRLTGIWSALRRTHADIYYVRCAGFILAPVVQHARMAGKKAVFCGADDPDFDPERVGLRYGRDRRLYHWGLNRCDAVVVQNHAQQELLERNFGRRGTLIYNGLGSRPGPPPPRGNDVLWVANLRSAKRPRRFLELARRLPERSFVMVGGRAPNDRGDRTLYDEVAAEAETLPNLRFTGALSLTEVDRCFDRAAVFVNTSEHEGFPNTFLQAWSRGVPVLSHVDPDGLVSEHRLGTVCADEDDMARGLSDLLAERVRLDRSSIKSFFDSNLALDTAVDRYERLFESLRG